MRQPVHGGNLAWAAAAAGCPPETILDFSASISPLGPPNSAIAAIHSQLSNLRHYPEPDYNELRLALGCFHKVPTEWILPGNGSAELLTLAGRDLAKLSATALITPAFGDYYRTLRAYNAKILEFPLSLRSGDWGLGSRIDKFISLSPGANSGLLLNNPHNPTGRLFSRKDILPCLEQYALVVVDEAFMDFLPPDEEQSLIGVVQEYPNLVVLRSLTKFYSLPGLRLGYAIAHPERLLQWQTWRDPWPVNTLAAAAAVAAIQDQEFQELTWKWLAPARNQLFQDLASIPGLQPLASAANFLLEKSERSSLQLQQQLLQHHQILIRDCLSFKELGHGFFRVAVRCQSDNQRLSKALYSITVDP
jgi:L-threonine-O-3-phosphate decarboxylase